MRREIEIGARMNEIKGKQKRERKGGVQERKKAFNNFYFLA